MSHPNIHVNNPSKEIKPAHTAAFATPQAVSPKHSPVKRFVLVTSFVIAILTCIVVVAIVSAQLFGDSWNANHNGTSETTWVIEPILPEVETDATRADIFPSLDHVYEQIDARRGEYEDALDPSGSSTPTTPTSPISPPAQNYWSYPDTIYACTRSGDDLLVLVNKQYQLPATYQPSDLVEVATSGIRVSKSGLYVRSIVINDLTALTTAASQEGLDLTVLSAFRSYATQQSTYAYWVNYNGGNVDAADSVSARPGHSQHQLGTALDFSTNEIADQLGVSFGTTRAGQWLAAHAWEYGFALAYPQGWESTTGYSYEPWHFRFIGRAYAAEWQASGLILEVWLEGKK